MLVRFITSSLLLYSISLHAAYVNPSTIDVGDGSDGACNFTDADSPLATGTYNCTTLTITGGTLTVASGAALVFKVQGDVVISGVISVNGGNGVDGVAGDVAKAGGTAGPGGFAGGAYTALNGGDGLGTGKGLGGTGAGAVIGPVGGGGGGGGRYSSSSPGNGIDGLSDTITNGVGGLGGSTSYGSESQFETTFAGGSGGGAGGSGDDSVGTIYSGSGGGGGGGAIKISASGDIEISGSITANGGNGGNAATYDGGTGGGGSGGGGSGGAVFLQTEGDIIVTGSISAVGGTGGVMPAGASTNGDGGSGGSGRIRLDDRDGVIIGAITPTAVTNNTSAVSAVQTFESSISCGSVEIVRDYHNDVFTFLFGFLLVFWGSRFIFRLKALTNSKQ